MSVSADESRRQKLAATIFEALLASPKSIKGTDPAILLQLCLELPEGYSRKVGELVSDGSIFSRSWGR